MSLATYNCLTVFLVYSSAYNSIPFCYELNFHYSSLSPARLEQGRYPRMSFSSFPPQYTRPCCPSARFLQQKQFFGVHTRNRRKLGTLQTPSEVMDENTDPKGSVRSPGPRNLGPGAMPQTSTVVRSLVSLSSRSLITVLAASRCCNVQVQVCSA